MTKYVAVKDDKAVFFNSQASFCEEYGVLQGAVSKCVNGDLQTTGGWKIGLLPPGFDVDPMTVMIVGEDVFMEDLFPFRGWWTVNEYADKLGVSRWVVTHRMKRGLLRWEKLGRKDIRIYGEVE